MPTYLIAIAKNMTALNNRTDTQNAGKDEKSNMNDMTSLVSEIQRLDAQYNLWGNIIIALLAITAFVGVCSALASLKQKSIGGQLNRTKDELAQLQEQQRIREKQISDENTAKANAVAETAKADAAQVYLLIL